MLGHRRQSEFERDCRKRSQALVTDEDAAAVRTVRGIDHAVGALFVMQRSCHVGARSPNRTAPIDQSTRFEMTFKSDSEREKGADVDRCAKTSSNGQLDGRVQVCPR